MTNPHQEAERIAAIAHQLADELIAKYQNLIQSDAEMTYSARALITTKLEDWIQEQSRDIATALSTTERETAEACAGIADKKDKEIAALKIAFPDKADGFQAGAWGAHEVATAIRQRFGGK